MKRTIKKPSSGPMPPSAISLSQNAVKAADRAFGPVVYKKRGKAS